MLRGLVACLGFVLIGCLGPSEDAGAAKNRGEVGFSQLPHETYNITDTRLASGPTSLFYNYQATTSDDPDAPLFVVTVGGPGGSVLLLALDLAGLTGLGHVLFIDARNSGFSHEEDVTAEDLAVRAARFSAANYNVFRDAADVAHVLLDFLEKHPEHRERGVFFVAESYGGARTAVLLDLFLKAPDYAAGARPFFSSALQARLESHFVERFGHVPSPSLAAEIFRGQILLQPVIAGRLQDEVAGELLEEPGSVLDELAEEHGTVYLRCSERPAPCDPFQNAHGFLQSLGRSRYDYRAPVSWLDSLLERASIAAAEPALLAETLAVTQTSLLHALVSRSRHAFRFVDVAERPLTALDQALPLLPPWDAYFIALHRELPRAFRTDAVQALGADADAEVLPALFVSNTRHVATMVTRAEYDLHIYAPALPVVLSRLEGVRDVATGPQPDTLTLTLDDGTTRRVFAPQFAASHAIGRDTPSELVERIAQFISAE